MYNNSKIKWQPGMELTAQVFMHQDADLDRRQEIAVRTAIGEGRIGLLPGFPFSAEGSFVDRTYEIVGLQCTALLASGKIISANENLSVTIPALKGSEFFVCLGIAEGEIHEFERDGVPYEGPVYELSVHTIEEIDMLDIIPLKRMVITDGMLNIDTEYIVPTLTISSDIHILEHLEKCRTRLLTLFTHEKISNAECKRSLLQLYMQLKGITKHDDIRFITTIYRELALTIEFYIIEQIGQNAPHIPDDVIRLNNDLRREYNQANLALYMQWMEEYVEVQTQILDIVEIKEQEIDFTKFKAEIKEELTRELSDLLYEKLKADLTTAITDDVIARITEIINQRIEQLHPELVTQLHENLHDPLYNELYNALYGELSKLSYKPAEQVIDTYVPLI